MVLNAELADLLVVLDDELANIRAEYEELEENQEELASIPEENEEQIEELASTDLLASEASSGSIVVIDLDDDDVEAMVEDVDEVIVGGDDEVMFVDDDEINSNSQLFPTASVASSESSTQGVLDDHLEAVELRRNREQFLQSAPVATASTDSAPSLTPLQEHNFRISIEQTRLRELRREEAELQAQLDEQLSVDQHTGYGRVQGNLDVFRDIEGVLPKLPSIQLTFNWLTNIENNFNLFI